MLDCLGAECCRHDLLEYVNHCTVDPSPHDSLFTGTFPSKHVAHCKHVYLAEGNRTLAEAWTTGTGNQDGLVAPIRLIYRNFASANSGTIHYPAGASVDDYYLYM